MISAWKSNFCTHFKNDENSLEVRRQKLHRVIQYKRLIRFESKAINHMDSPTELNKRNNNKYSEEIRTQRSQKHTTEKNTSKFWDKLIAVNSKIIHAFLCLSNFLNTVRNNQLIRHYFQNCYINTLTCLYFLIHLS